MTPDSGEGTNSFRECVIIRHPRRDGEFAFAFITGQTTLQVGVAGSSWRPQWWHVCACVCMPGSAPPAACCALPRPRFPASLLLASSPHPTACCLGSPPSPPPLPLPLQTEEGETALYCCYVPTNHVYVGDIFLLPDRDIIRNNLSGARLWPGCGGVGRRTRGERVNGTAQRSAARAAGSKHCCARPLSSAVLEGLEIVVSVGCAVPPRIVQVPLVLKR